MLWFPDSRPGHPPPSHTHTHTRVMVDRTHSEERVEVEGDEPGHSELRRESLHVQQQDCQLQETKPQGIRISAIGEGGGKESAFLLLEGVWGSGVLGVYARQELFEL